MVPAAASQLAQRCGRSKEEGKTVANKFVLKGSGVEVDYTAGITPGLVALVYKAGAFERTFKSADIKVESTGLGQMVSVSLLRTVDTGGERFGFFLPQIDVPKGQTAPFNTVGIYETFSGPDSIPHRPSTWRCIEMSGTAQTVIIPL
jgi:hypothetical protein